MKITIFTKIRFSNVYFFEYENLIVNLITETL